MTLFSRNISVDIVEGENGNLVVTSRMVDRLHDITVTLDVSYPDYTIVDADVVMTMVPSEHCYLMYPIAKKLIGLRIAKGFNRSVVGILAGVQGCSNVLNLVLVGAPLAINAAHLREEALRDTEDDLPAADPCPPSPVYRHEKDHYLKGTCIAHP